MKALELTVYPKLERPRRGDEIMAYRSQFIDEQLIIQAKRFTDAEIAAEFWAASTEASQLMGRPRRGGKTYAAKVANTLYRFATLPHYDEVQP